MVTSCGTSAPRAELMLEKRRCRSETNWATPSLLRIGVVEQQGVALSTQGIGAAAIGGDSVQTVRSSVHAAVLWRAAPRWQVGLWFEGYTASIDIPATSNDDLIERFPSFDTVVRDSHEAITNGGSDLDSVEDAVDDLRDGRLTDAAKIRFSGVTIGALFAFDGVPIVQFAGPYDVPAQCRLFAVDLGVHGTFLRGELELGESGGDTFQGHGGGVRLGIGGDVALGPFALGAQWAVHIDALMDGDEFLAATFNHGAFVFLSLDPGGVADVAPTLFAPPRSSRASGQF